MANIDKPEKNYEKTEIKISPKLADKLEGSRIKSSVEGLIDFKKMVDEFLSQNSLTDEMKTRVSGKMEKLTEVYIEVNKINLSHRSNAEKEIRIKKVLEKIGLEEFDNVNSEIDAINKRFAEIDKEIEESVEIVNKKHERLKNKDIPEGITIRMKPLTEYSESTKGTLAQKKESENRDENSENKTSLAIPEKKNGFLDKFARIFSENPENDWVREDIEQDGKHIVRYKDELGNVKSEYEASENIAENERRDANAKKFGFFSRIKAVFTNEEKNKIRNEVMKKREAIEKQMAEISEMASEGAYEYADKCIDEFCKKIEGKLPAPLKDIMDRLSDSHEWALKKKEELENRKVEILKESEELTRAGMECNKKIWEVRTKIYNLEEAIEKGSDKAFEINFDLADTQQMMKNMKRSYDEKKEKGTLQKEYGAHIAEEYKKLREEVRQLRQEKRDEEARSKLLEEEYKQNIGEKDGLEKFKKINDQKRDALIMESAKIDEATKKVDSKLAKDSKKKGKQKEEGEKTVKTVKTKLATNRAKKASQER